MIHRYLFFIDGEDIQSYKFNKDKIELIKYKGELACNVNDESFWDWWEKSNSYISSEDSIDFCFLGNMKFEFFKCNYKTVEASEWGKEDIEKFSNEHIKYSSMKLNCINQQEEQYLQFVKSPTACDYQKTVEFNIFIVPSVILSNNYNEKSKTDKEHSLLREYYREQLYNKI